MFLANTVRYRGLMPLRIVALGYNQVLAWSYCIRIQILWLQRRWEKGYL